MHFQCKAPLSQTQWFEFSKYSVKESYYIYASSRDAPPLVKEAMRIQRVLSTDQEYCWYNNVQRLVSEARINSTRPKKGQLQKIQDILQKSYRSHWTDKMDDCDNITLQSVRRFKIQFGPESTLRS